MLRKKKKSQDNKNMYKLRIYCRFKDVEAKTKHN